LPIEEYLAGWEVLSIELTGISRDLKLFLPNYKNYPYLVAYHCYNGRNKNKQIMKKDTLEYRMMQERQRIKNHDSKLLNGSIKDKYPVVIDGGKTIIFISDKSKEAETRQKYKLLKESKFPSH